MDFRPLEESAQFEEEDASDGDDTDEVADAVIDLKDKVDVLDDNVQQIAEATENLNTKLSDVAAELTELKDIVAQFKQVHKTSCLLTTALLPNAPPPTLNLLHHRDSLTTAPSSPPPLPASSSPPPLPHHCPSPHHRSSPCLTIQTPSLPPLTQQRLSRTTAPSSPPSLLYVYTEKQTPMYVICM